MKKQTSDQWRDFGGTSPQPLSAPKGHHLLPCNLESSEISGIVLPFWLPRVFDCFATQWVYLAGRTSSVMLAGGYVAPPLGVTGHRWTACLHSEAIYHRAIEVLWVWVILDHTWSHEVALYVCKSWININLFYIVDMFYTNLCVLFIRIASRNIWPSLTFNHCLGILGPLSKRQLQLHGWRVVFKFAPNFLRLNEKLDAWHVNRPGTADGLSRLSRSWLCQLEASITAAHQQ